MADKIKLASVVRESLIWEFPYPVRVQTVIFEKLVGDGYGYNSITNTYSVVRESLVREAPVSVFSVVRESLLSRPSEDATQAYLVPLLRQTVVAVRSVVPLPGDVRSNTDIASHRQIVVIGRALLVPYSLVAASTLRQHVTFERQVVPAPQMHSVTEANTLRMLVVQSRGRAYEPISMVYSAQLRSQVIQHRETTPAGDIRTPIRIGSHVQQIVQSRVHAQVVIQTYAYVPSLWQQVIAQDTRPAPISATSVSALRMMVLREHTMPAPGIDDRVGQMVQQVAQLREITAPHGEDIVAGMSQQVTLARQVGPLLSPTIVRSTRMLALMRKESIPPSQFLGRHAASLVQQVTVERVTPAKTQSLTRVASMRMQFVLFRDMPLPIEVIDPSIGRHVFGLRMLTVQRRVTEPPESISTFSRFAHSVVGQVVVADAFDPPPYPEPVLEISVGSLIEQAVYRDRDEWVPVTALTVKRAESALVVLDADDWVDPTMPQSAVSASGALQQLAIGGEQYPDPLAPHSDIDAVLVAAQVAVGDPDMPDPMLPLSEVASRAVIESAATGDPEWPDPTIPLSDVSVRRVAAILALHDPLLTGVVGGSDARALTLFQVYVTRDPTLVGIPLRQGPRPVVSVTIS